MGRGSCMFGGTRGCHCQPRPPGPSPASAVCEQCHLEGEARVLAGRGRSIIGPVCPCPTSGRCWSRAAERPRRQAVTHVEQMVQSKCFQRPAARCSWVASPVTTRTFGSGRRSGKPLSRACMKCHDEAKGQRGCSEGGAQREHASPRCSCIACHMPRYSNSDVVHAAATDHRILRRPADHPPGPRTDRDDARFVDFYQDRFPQGDPQAEAHARSWAGENVRRRNAVAATARPAGAGVPGVGAGFRSAGRGNGRASKAQLLLQLGRHSERWRKARTALANGRATGDCPPRCQRGPDGRANGLRGDAEVSPDPDYVFADKVGAKYGSDLRVTSRGRPGTWSRSAGPGERGQHARLTHAAPTPPIRRCLHR